MKPFLIFSWILLDYFSLKSSATGQTSMFSADNRTIPVCTDATCESTGCGNPFDGLVPACSCDYGCTFFEDCCIDYTVYCGQTTLDGSVTSGDHIPSAFQDATRSIDRSQVTCVTLSQGMDHFWMVSSCPLTWANDQVKTRCEEYQPTSDLDLAAFPVSLDGLLTYKNVYCAICNGLSQNDVTPWNLQLLCSQNLTDMVESGNTTLAELLTSGECTSSIDSPQDSTPSGSRKCLPSGFIDDCPEDTNPDVYETCTLYQDFVTDENGTVYRNPYCKLCNEIPGAILAESQEYIMDICLASAVTTPRPPKPTPNRGNGGSPTSGSGDRGILNPDINALQPLSIIMDFSKDSGVQIVYSENIIKTVDISCQPWEVFDPFLQKCLTLSCADGYELRDNVCHRLTPPLNLTCGSDGSDLKLILSALVGLGSTILDACEPDHLTKNITNFIENALYIQSGQLHPLRGSKIPEDDGIRLMSDDDDRKCLSLSENSLRMDYVIESREMSFTQLEELADRTLLEYDTNALLGSEYHIESLIISQQCIAVSGLDQCPSGLTVLTNATILHEQNYTIVLDEKTGNIYHSYETIFMASFEKNVSVEHGGYAKLSSIQVCNQMKMQTCSLIIQPASHFLRLNDASLNNTLTGQILARVEYTLTANGSVQYCAPDSYSRNGTFNQTTTVGIFAYDEIQVILSFVGVSLSLISLFITFTTYCTFSHMRRCVSNKLIMVLCIVLFFAQLLQMVSGLGTHIPELCTALSVVSHFLWTSVFALTTCLAFELNRTLAARDSFTVSTDSTRAIVAYLLFTFLTSSILVGCCLAIHFTVGDELQFSYGNDHVCWIVNQVANLIAFGCPLAVFLIMNTVLFLHTVVGIRNTSKVRRSMIVETQNVKETSKELRVYLKISTLMGFTWSFGFIAGFANISALWYVFIILNSLQGFYIFLAFIANRRVYSMWTLCLCYCNTSGSLNRHSRGTFSVPLSQRMSRMTSVSSLPRNSEYVSNADRRHSGEKNAGSHRYTAASQKAKITRTSSGVVQKDSGADSSETNGDRGSPGRVRTYSHGEWKYAGERKQSGDQRYQTARDWRNVNGSKSAKNQSKSLTEES